MSINKLFFVNLIGIIDEACSEIREVMILIGGLFAVIGAVSVICFTANFSLTGIIVLSCIAAVGIITAIHFAKQLPVLGKK